MKPLWIIDAEQYIGLKEVPGPQTNSTISGWLSKLHAWWSDDSTPWCGAYVAAMLEQHSDLPRHWYRAKSWLDWGIPIDNPEVGCIVVFGREGGGHVGFVVGRDRVGNLLVLGGNQGDEVSVRAFARNRVLGYRWPEHQALIVGVLPLGFAETSRSEA